MWGSLSLPSLPSSYGHAVCNSFHSFKVYCTLFTNRLVMNVTCPKVYIGATHNRLEKLLQFVYEQLSYTILAINKINTSQLPITAPVEDVRLYILCICLFFSFTLIFIVFCTISLCILLFIHVLFSSIPIMCFISSFNVSLFLCPLSLSLSISISLGLSLSCKD